MYKMPTDSLYKFCALSGLVIALLSIYYPHALLLDLHEKCGVVTREIDVAEAEHDYLTSYLARAQAIVQNGVAGEEVHSTVKIHGLVLTYSDADIKVLLDRIYEDLRDLEIATAYLHQSNEETLRLWRNIQVIRWLSGLGLGIGILLAVYGFRMWYVRIQVYQDRMLATSALTDNKTEQGDRQVSSEGPQSAPSEEPPS